MMLLYTFLVLVSIVSFINIIGQRPPQDVDWDETTPSENLNDGSTPLEVN